MDREEERKERKAGFLISECKISENEHRIINTERNVPE